MMNHLLERFKAYSLLLSYFVCSKAKSIFTNLYTKKSFVLFYFFRLIFIFVLNISRRKAMPLKKAFPSFISFDCHILNI